MTTTETTNEGIADELGIQVGDWVTISRGWGSVEGWVTDIAEDGDSVEFSGVIGLLFDLVGADVSIA